MLEYINFLNEPKPNYLRIWDFQKRRVEQIASREAPEALIFCEHELVATKGRRYQEGNILDSDIPIYEIERGGDVTLHQPGQLVVYPLMNLHGPHLIGGLHPFMRICEEVVIRTLKSFNLDAGRFGPTGVWIKEKSGRIRKIASLGIAVRRWITYHGISINISNDLGAFQKIRPCNFEASIMTSLEEQKISTTVSEVAQRLLNEFRQSLVAPVTDNDAERGGGTAEFKIPANF